MGEQGSGGEEPERSTHPMEVHPALESKARAAAEGNPMSLLAARLVIQDMVDEARMTIGEMSRALARIESKLDRELADHEARLRRIEQWMWVTSGLAVAGAGSSVFAWLQVAGKG